MTMTIEEFDYHVDILASILWQYNESTNLLSLINKKQDWYNLYESDFWENWFNQVFNLSGNQMTLFGLAVWSIILDVPLYVPINPEDPAKPIWGFNSFVGGWPNLANSYLNFFGPTSTTDGANFSTRGQNIILKLAEQQFLLRLKYFNLTTRGDINDINYFLAYLVSTSNIGYTGALYVLDGLDMEIVYVFTEAFPKQLLAALRALDMFPRPAGVGVRIVENNGFIFGFNQIDGALPNLENINKNFENGNFYPESYYS